MVRLCLKSLAMLVAWTGLLMIFTSAGGSLVMLSELLFAVCGAAYLLAHAGQLASRALGGNLRETRHPHDLAA